MERRRVLVTAEQQLDGDGIVAILKNVEWLQIVSDSVNIEKAVESFKPGNSDMVIMDMPMADSECLEKFSQIKNHFSANKLFVVSKSNNIWFVSNLLKQGINGFFLKTSSSESLVDAIQDVFADEIFIPEDISKMLVKEYISTNKGSNQRRDLKPEKDNHDHIQNLTSRELDILKHLAQGASSPQIADQLCISELTVNTHRKHILKKLGFHNTTSLVRYVVERGMIA